ncbi:MAG: hypothetical protein GX557_01980 [Chloroflexi bacterium]|nr:hypothetical protein [Chloroflexota bacterium]
MASNMPQRGERQGATPRTPRDEAEVNPRYACPQCGERRKRFLMWLSAERVRCLSCGATYTVLGIPA